MGFSGGTTAHRLLEERIEDVGEQLAVHEHRLAEVERALSALEHIEIDVRWVTESLAHFDTVWDVMNLENQGRLVRAIVERVEVDECSGQVTAVLLDLGMGDTTPAGDLAPALAAETTETTA